MESRDMQTDETPSPTASWRDSCKKAIIPKAISSTHRDSIFAQATVSKRVWSLMVEVMNLYENAKLKGQKLNLSSLLSKPEFKQQYLAPIRCLNEDDQCSLLVQVIEGKNSLAELKVQAAEHKQMHALRTAFVRLTNVESWEAAQEMFPQFATNEKLHRFVHTNLKKAVPQSLIDFCQRAKSSSLLSRSEDSLVIPYGTVSAVVVECKITEVSGQTIQSSYSAFRGANLIIAIAGDVCVREEIESLAYTIKEVNAVVGLQLYSAAIVCTPAQLSIVHEVWAKAFINTECLYAANTSLPRQSLTSLTQCVSVVVLGLFSSDDEVKPEHFIYDQGDRRCNSVVCTEEELFKYIIAHFSHPSSVVLDITSTQGTATVAALSLNRSCICIASQEDTPNVMAKIHDIPPPDP